MIIASEYNLLPVRRDGQQPISLYQTSVIAGGTSGSVGTTYTGGTNIIICGTSINVCGTVATANNSVCLSGVAGCYYARKANPYFTGLVVADHLCVCGDLSANNFYTSNVVYNDGSAAAPAIRFCSDPSRGFYKNVNNDIIATAGFSACECLTAQIGGCLIKINVDPNNACTGNLYSNHNLIIHSSADGLTGTGSITFCAASINGISAANVGLGNVSNTTDASKCVCYAATAGSIAGTATLDITANLTSGQLLTYNGTTITSTATVGANQLPIATASCFGAIKVGSGLAINSGVLSATGASLDTLDITPNISSGQLLCYNGTTLVGTPASGFWSNNGSWFADLGSYGYTRFMGNEYNTGAIALLTCANAGAQTTVLIDGNFIAGETNGFYSLNTANTYASRAGFRNDGSGGSAFNSYVTVAGYIDSVGRINACSNGGNGGFISTGNHGGTGNAAYFPSGLWANGSYNWMYGHTYMHSVSATGCISAVDFIATSDRSCKKDIQKVNNALSTVLQLKGVTYKLCDDDMEKCRVGMIAQDVLPILPEVIGRVDDGTLGIDYSKVVPILVEAIKELKKEIIELENRFIDRF